MSLTFQQIWEQFSHVEFKRHLYVKRLKTDGTYESDFTEITQGLKDGGVQGISRQLPNDSWEFGYVTVDNVQLEILSAYQEFANEQDPNSIFFGFIRNFSIIKIVDAFVDKYTDPLNPVEATVETFEGLFDSTTAQTQQGYEEFSLLDYLYVLNNINVSSLTLTQTTLDALVYEIMNRPEFTKYFSVSNSTTYIKPAYNTTLIDVTQYASDTVMDMLQDLAKGHSMFYINPEDNHFYFVAPMPTPSVQFSFLENNNRKLEISNYREGIDRQITSWYWTIEDGSVLSAISFPSPVNALPSEFDVAGVTDNTQRQNLLNFVLAESENAKPYFTLKLPYFPIINLLDRVVVQSFGSAPVTAARWGMFQFTSSSTSNPNAAPRWFKPAGIRISKDLNWMVRGISHDNNLTTTLELERIL